MQLKYKSCKKYTLFTENVKCKKEDIVTSRSRQRMKYANEKSFSSTKENHDRLFLTIAIDRFVWPQEEIRTDMKFLWRTENGNERNWSKEERERVCQRFYISRITRRVIVSKNREMLLHNIVISSIYVYTFISGKRDRDLERVSICMQFFSQATKSWPSERNSKQFVLFLFFDRAHRNFPVLCHML